MAARLVESGASPEVVRIDLGPLAESETRELVAQVGRGLGELRDTHETIVGRAAGNALYAEQLVRLFEAEPPAVRRRGPRALKDRAARALPDSLQSLIAARLDELAPARKAVLADAAVVGEVFWTGAVAALDGGDRPPPRRA